MNDLINSSIATCVAEVLTLPICTIKTNYQNTNSNSIPNTIKDIYKRNGLKSFYSASYPAIFSQVFSTSSKYFLYQYFENKNYKYSNKFTNGLFAGIISSLFTHPIDIIKIHQQMNTKFIPELKNHGIKLFYRGYSKTFSKIALSSTFFFPLYDTFYEKFKSPTKSALLTSILVTFIMHPIDYLKTRHIYNLPLYNELKPKIITKTIFNKNVKVFIIPLYKGIIINLLRIVPHFIITMNVIDYLKN